MSAITTTTPLGDQAKPPVSPLTSTGGTPGHLASEHLAPALVSFASTGERNDNGAGKLCGNVTAASLDQVPVPLDLQMGGALACNQGYTASNSLLDVLVGGCTVPQPGAGGPYTLQWTGTNVTGCRDKNNMNVNLTDCLNAAAYSAFFKLAMGRVIVK